MWITKTLKRIIAAHAARRFPFNNRGFALGEGESHEQGFARVEGELATANTALATAKEAGGKNFFGGLSEGMRSNPSMVKFKDKSGEDIATSYLELEKKIGAKGVIVPIDGASEQEISDFHKATGRPDAADGYQITVPEKMHKSIVSTPESQKVFKEQCFKVGLNNKGAQSLHSWYMTELSNVLTQQDEAEEKTSNEAKTALHAKWGTTYDTQMALAAKVVNVFAGDAAQDLLDKGLGSNPAMIELFATIGSKLSEDVLGPGGKSGLGGLSKQTAEDRKTAILADTKHAYHNTGAGHAEAVAEMLELNKIITAGKSQNEI